MDKNPDQRQHYQIHVSARTVAVAVATAWLVTALVYGVWQVRDVIAWFIAATFLAIAADPAVRVLQRRGLGRVGAVTVFALATLATLGGLSWLFLAPLIEQAGRLIENTPQIIEQIQDSRLFQRADERFGIVDRLADQAAELPQTMTDSVLSLSGAIVKGLFGAFTIFALSALLLVSGERLIRRSLQLMPQLGTQKRWAVAVGAYNNVSRYIGGMLVVAFIGTLSALLLFWLVGVPYPLPLALWVGLWILVPIIGATVGAIPAIIVAFFVDPWRALVVLGAVVVYQQVESSFIAPAIVGRAVKLPPVITFLAVLVGINLMGIVGALIAIPLSATAQIVLDQFADRQERENPQQVEQAQARVDDLPVADE